MVAHAQKTPLLLIVVIWITAIPAFCQNQDKQAVLVEFTLGIHYPLEGSFPNIFLENPTLEAQILSTTDSLIKTHFEAKAVERRNEIKVETYNAIVLGRPESLKGANRENGDIFISIRSGLSSASKSTYKLNLSIRAEDKSGTTVFNEKTKVRFTVGDVSKEREILGYPLLASHDFEHLYVEALLGAFHKKKKLPKQAFTRPPDYFLTHFAAGANMYYLAGKKKNPFSFLLQDSLKNSLGIVALDEQIAIDKKMGNFLNFLVSKSAARKAAKFHLKNDLHQTKYEIDVWGKGYDDGDLAIDITFLLEENTLGEMRYQHGLLEGKLHKTTYSTASDYQVLKFFQEGTGLIALITHDHQKAYFAETLSKEAIGEIMNMFMAYQIANEIADRIYSALDNRAEEDSEY